MNEYKGPDPLAAWCSAEMKLNIDGKELVVKPSMKHYRELKAMMNEGPEKAKENLEKQNELFKDILRTTYPDSVSVDDFIERYEQKFQMAIISEVVGIPVEELKKKFFQEMEKTQS